MASFDVSGSASAVLPLSAVAAFAGAPDRVRVAVDAHADATVKAADGTVVTAYDALSAVAGGFPAEVAELVQRVLRTRGASDAAREYIHANAPTVRALLNMGVRQSRQQVEFYTRALADEEGHAVLAALFARLSSSTFVAGERITAADVVLAAGLWDLLTLVYVPTLLGSSGAANAEHAVVVSRWFATVRAHPSVADAASALRLVTGGSIRVGGQVDLRPDPVRVSALADGSIARNAGHHKAASQREAEKSSKEGGHAEAAAAPSASPVSGASPAAAAAVAATTAQPEANKSLPGLSAEERIAITSQRLGAAGIVCTLHRHAAANTVDDLLAAIGTLPGIKVKNLFIKAKKEKAPGDSRMWLVVAAHDTKVDLVDLAKRLGYGKIVLRFGDAESLLENLGCVQGHVSPLCLMNDTCLAVNVALDAALLAPGAGPVYVHPLTNEASVGLDGGDLVKFIHSTGHSFTTVDFSKPA